jgi:hypothetical protein
MCVVTAVAVCGWGRVAIEQQWHAGAVFATAMVVRVALAYSDCCDNPLMTFQGACPFRMNFTGVALADLASAK